MELAGLEELPEEYQDSLSLAGVTPLWPLMRQLLPQGAPSPICLPAYWSFKKLRPLLLRAGGLVPVEKAERRVLVLSGSCYGEAAAQVTPAIYLGMQLLLPGESAPSHRHTPSAARIVVEGEGASTIVQGEKLPMEPGDLVLTPGGEWHEHVHEGSAPVIWLDALDLPLFVYLEASYAEMGLAQKVKDRAEAGSVEYTVNGLRAARPYDADIGKYPLRRFPWTRTEKALHAIIEAEGASAAEVDFVNPETGDDVLPTLGFSAMMVRAARRYRQLCRSASAAFHVVRGHGRSRVNDKIIDWADKDTFSAPAFASIEHQADKDSYLIRMDEAPFQKKLGFFEERK